MDQFLPEIIHVVVIEDNEADYVLIRTMLEKEEPLFETSTESGHSILRFKTSWVEDCADMGNTLQTLKPDVVLLDYLIPGVNGFDVLGLIVNNFPNLPVIIFPNLPVIMLTGVDSIDLGEKALRGGAQDYLEKNRLSTITLIKSIHWAVLRMLASASNISFHDFRERYRFDPGNWEKMNEAADRALKT